MPEPADQLAARLAVGGDPISVHIEETETTYVIGWQGRYQIDGETFIYEDNQSRRLNAITGLSREATPARHQRKLSVDTHRRSTENCKYLWLVFILATAE